MTNVEWVAATDPRPMLKFLRGRAGDRQLRLLGVAIARASWNRLTDERSRRAIEIAERYADGEADRSALEAVVDGAWDVRDELFDAGPSAHDARLWLAEAAGLTASVYEWDNTFRHPASSDGYPFLIPSPAHCGLTRCVFGNPFRPIAFIPAWLTPTAVGLADAMYADRAFDRLPILADALQDAGSEDAAVLGHCRGGGPHVLGCWVVDGVLGKG